MPLTGDPSRDIPELRRSGRPQDQAVAIAMKEARKIREDGGRTENGYVDDVLRPFGQSRMVGDETPLFDEGQFKAAVADRSGPNNSKSIRYLHHDNEGVPTGALQIRTHGPRTKKATIQNVYVADHARRQGIASKLLARARQDYDVKHSDDLTNDGKAFARARRADGGLNFARVRDPASKVKLHTGPIHASVAGRTDHLPMHVPHGAYVLPADIVSAMGEGNTLAGFKIAARLPKSMFAIHNRTSGTPYSQKGLPYGAGSGPYGQSGLPYGAPSPESRGGTPPNTADSSVPIVAAGGEHVYSPEECTMIGGGDIDKGHKILDEFVKMYREKTIKKLDSLPGPRRD